jgi:hypothetical protein
LGPRTVGLVALPTMGARFVVLRTQNTDFVYLRSRKNSPYFPPLPALRGLRGVQRQRPGGCQRLALDAPGVAASGRCQINRNPHSPRKITDEMQEEDVQALRTAKAVLEHPRFAARLAEIAGKPIELFNRRPQRSRLKQTLSWSLYAAALSKGRMARAIRCTVPVPTPRSLAVARMPFPARNSA